MRTAVHKSSRKRKNSYNGGSSSGNLWSGVHSKSSETLSEYQSGLAFGSGPFIRFLSPDDGDKVYPNGRIVILMILGFCFSTVMIEFTADGYYQGASMENQEENKDENNQGPTQFHLAFHDIGCSISGLPNPILQNISGEILPGRFTGILGQSGSGKTSFAYALLGKSRHYCAHEYGAVYLNGHPQNLESLLDHVGLVPQDDIMYSDLTVEEAIGFSANWRLPRNITYEQRREAIDDTVRTLRLERIRNRRIGDVRRRGISGGEKKRTSIGIELVSRPSVLIMDEPTSGLDSAAAYNLARILRDIADSGVSVVAILHQPSERIFELLDDIILLQRGEAAYVGPRTDVFPFLAEMGYVIPDSPNSCNSKPSAEFILDILADLEQPDTPPVSTNVLSSTVVDEICLNNITASSCFSHFDNRTHPRLPLLWRAYQEGNQTWNRIREKMKNEYLKENSFQNEICKNNDTRKESNFFRNLMSKIGVTLCSESDARFICRMFAQTFDKRNRHRPKQRATPGFNMQLHWWFWQLARISWRKGLLLETFVVISLAGVVGFVRSFNRSWNRKPVSNLFLSLSISLLGMMGAVYNDEIEPVKRAASSGMLLGAHEFAVLAHALGKGWCVCHVFSLAYFTVLYIRTGEWLPSPQPEEEDSNTDLTASGRCKCFLKNLRRIMNYNSWTRFHKYYEFTHINHLNYVAASAIGSAICVFSNHNDAVAHISAVATLITVHVFAFFTPNRNQVKRDTIVFGSYNLAPLVEALCAISYVRYYLEAMLLWEPEDEDKNGKTFVLRYYGYKTTNKTYCCIIMFTLWTVWEVIRYIMFALRNSNDFHSLYDTPLFIMFLLKVLSCHVAALFLMTMIQEWYFPWLARLQNRHRDTDEVIDVVTNHSTLREN